MSIVNVIIPVSIALIILEDGRLRKCQFLCCVLIMNYRDLSNTIHTFVKVQYLFIYFCTHIGQGIFFLIYNHEGARHCRKPLCRRHVRSTFFTIITIYGRNIESLRRPGGFRQCRAPSWFHDKNLFMESSLMLAGMEASNTPHVLSPFLYPCR